MKNNVIQFLLCTVYKVKMGSEKMQRATSHTILLESIMHDFALIANVCTFFIQSYFIIHMHIICVIYEELLIPKVQMYLIFVL